jgi:hypothetical protein
MLPRMHVAMAGFAGAVALINLVQVFTGRQLIRPAKSRRSAPQLRRESAFAAGLAFAMTLMSLHVIWAWGYPLILACMVGLFTVRRRYSQR